MTASPRDPTGGMGNAYMQAAIGGPLVQSASLGNLSEEESLKQQLYQERMAKEYPTLSTTMTKDSDPESAITANLK